MVFKSKLEPLKCSEKTEVSSLLVPVLRTVFARIRSAGLALGKGNEITGLLGY